jgi:hypothetical protein
MEEIGRRHQVKFLHRSKMEEEIRRLRRVDGVFLEGFLRLHHNNRGNRPPPSQQAPPWSGGANPWTNAKLGRKQSSKTGTKTLTEKSRVLLEDICQRGWS